MDNAYLGSVDISQKKARTVTLFNGLFPSNGLLNRSQPMGDLFGIEETNGMYTLHAVLSAALHQLERSSLWLLNSSSFLS